MNAPVGRSAATILEGTDAGGVGPPAIVAQGLTRTFGSVTALDGLTFEVPSGAVFGFLGPNGSGKTTTISLLLGLLEPDRGRAEVLGRDPFTLGSEVRERVGALLEHPGVYEHMTAEENLEFYGRAWRLTTAERRDRSRELLEPMGLWDRRRERAGSWSRGMRQKLAVARALLHRPELVFLDEPTAGLDVVAANELRALLARIAEAEGVTVFLTTHNMAEAERLCRRVAVIRDGRLVAEGAPDELRARAGAPVLEIRARGLSESVLAVLRGRPEVADARMLGDSVLVHLTGDVDTSPLVRLLLEAGVSIDEVRRGSASLEDVFLTLMEES